MVQSINENGIYFCEDNHSRKYKMSEQERRELYVVAQKYKNVNSIIIRKWLVRPYYVGEDRDVKQLMKVVNVESNAKNEIKRAEKQYILDKWIHCGVYTIKKKDIEKLCE